MLEGGEEVESSGDQFSAGYFTYGNQNLCVSCDFGFLTFRGYSATVLPFLFSVWIMIIELVPLIPSI